jgi:cyclophilin family peptidyl-prolyl cis-trans isomerase
LFCFVCSVHVIFGHIIQGIEIVQDIENQPTNDKSCPVADIRIDNCGELIPKSKAKGRSLAQSEQNFMYRRVYC